MHFLIFKLGGLGDLVLVTPALRGLRKSLPQARISLVTGFSNRLVLDGCPYVDQILIVDDRRFFQGGTMDQARAALDLIRLAKAQKPDVVFVLHRDWRWNLIFRLSRTRNRLGFQRDLGGAFLTRAAVTSPEEHEINKYIKVFGLWPGFHPDGIRMELFPRSEDQAIVAGKIAPLTGRPVLALAPGGAANIKESRTISRWPLELYRELVRRVLDETEFGVLLVGGPGDRDFTRPLVLNDRVLDLAGGLTPVQTYLALKECRLMITHDCGPMHIAAAAGLPVISLFGPTDPREKAPITNSRSVNIWKGPELGCSPCYHDGRFPDCAHQQCLTSIGVDEVMARATEIMDSDK
ncbi:MAG: glycosyltransferase family 9 protein [Thermodesulfobacteriota bacterium]